MRKLRRVFTPTMMFQTAVSLGNNAYVVAASSSPNSSSMLESWKSTLASGMSFEPGHANVGPQLTVLVVIFVVSLLAVSFPSISKRVHAISIPRIIFFIGKHFGTGVILSTAFVHLLQDAFETLQDPRVKAQWDTSRLPGLIVLGSLLTIFAIEFVSTSYVFHLQSNLSTPPTPSRSRRSSDASNNRHTPPISSDSDQATAATPPCVSGSSFSHAPRSRHYHSRSKSFSYGSSAPPARLHGQSIFEGHHRHESRDSHVAHHDLGLRKGARWDEVGAAGAIGPSAMHAHSHGHDVETGDEERPKFGTRRQVVGILVLQMGIMIHSLIIGITLGIVTSGSEFTSLVVAIIFHQLFEGLSLGIRISSISTDDNTTCFSFLSLKQTLAVLFAVTTPLGILIGVASIIQGRDRVQLLLAQGLMSGISAGMLIYAATVEMLAGDFVMDPTLWKKPVKMQALALVSLAAGAAAMAMVE